jgi:hypothetical protein
MIYTHEVLTHIGDCFRSGYPYADQNREGFTVSKSPLVLKKGGYSSVPTVIKYIKTIVGINNFGSIYLLDLADRPKLSSNEYISTIYENLKSKSRGRVFFHFVSTIDKKTMSILYKQLFNRGK